MSQQIENINKSLEIFILKKKSRKVLYGNCRVKKYNKQN